jgi:hypothetical protein
MIHTHAVRERWIPSSPEEHSEVLHAAGGSAGKSTFLQQQALSSFAPVVEQTLLGHGDEIKERTVGREPTAMTHGSRFRDGLLEAGILGGFGWFYGVGGGVGL